VWRKPPKDDAEAEPLMVYANDFYVVKRMHDPGEGDSALMRLHLPQDGLREFTIAMSKVTQKDELRKILSSNGVYSYGKRFDIPHINREFLEADMTPPSPFKHIDLLSTVKKRFRFPSNKLEYVVNRLGIGEKLKHEGFELWRRCMANEESAWKLMRQYNINDVALTELLYERLKPWISSVPSFAAHAQERVCPACGAEDIQPRGYAYTAQSRYRRYRCNICGKWSRDTKGDTINMREVAD
jgi:hypothetical protein